MKEKSAQAKGVVNAGVTIDAPPKIEKDVWDKFSVVSKFLSSVVIGCLGVYFTHVYGSLQEAKQLRLSELQTIEKFIPHLTDTEESKRFAIIAISSLGYRELATKLATADPSRGNISALVSLFVSGDPQAKALAGSALEQLYSNFFASLKRATDYYSRFLLVASDTSINVSSSDLIRIHKYAAEGRRREIITEHDEAVREYVATLSDLQKDAQRLTRYFEFLALAVSSESYANLDATDGLLAPLVEAQATKSNAVPSEQSGIDGVPPHSITASKAYDEQLQQELNRHGQIVVRKFDLQHHALENLLPGFKDRLELLHDEQEAREVVAQFAGASPLPTDWAERWRDNMVKWRNMESLDLATEIPLKMKKAFIALVEGTLSQAEIELLNSDIDAATKALEFIKVPD